MPAFEHSVEIAAPVDTVFAFSTDPSNWRRMNSSLSDVAVVDERGDDPRLTATYRMLGLPIETELERIIVEPNAHAVTTFQSDALAGELHWRFAETDDGTEVRLRADYDFGDSLLVRVLRPVAKRYNERQFRQVLRTTRDLIEAEHPTKATAEA